MFDSSTKSQNLFFHALGYVPLDQLLASPYFVLSTNGIIVVLCVADEGYLITISSQ
jgi:hypothetical protein